MPKVEIIKTGTCSECNKYCKTPYNYWFCEECHSLINGSASDDDSDDSLDIIPDHKDSTLSFDQESLDDSTTSQDEEMESKQPVVGPKPKEGSSVNGGPKGKPNSTKKS